MNRFTAFAIHLGISVAIFLALLMVIVFIWYPGVYFATDGGWQGIRLIAAIDVVLGPFLTLIVFRSGKPGLRRDLTIIGIVQTLALSFGVWVVHSERPVLVAFTYDRFLTMNAQQAASAGGRAVAIVKESERLPAYVFIDLPEDPKGSSELRREAASAGKFPYMLGDRYEHLTPANIRSILRHALDIDKLVKDRPADQKRLQAFVEANGGTLGDYAFVPLKSRYKLVLFAFAKKDLRPAGPLNIDATALVSFL